MKDALVGNMRESRLEYWKLRAKQAENLYTSAMLRNNLMPEVAKQFCQEADGALRIEFDQASKMQWNCHIVGCEGQIEGFADGYQTIGEAVRAALRDALGVTDDTEVPGDDIMWRLAWESRGIQKPERPLEKKKPATPRRFL